MLGISVLYLKAFFKKQDKNVLSLSGTHFFGLTLARFSLSRVTFLRQLCAYYRVRKNCNKHFEVTY